VTRQRIHHRFPLVISLCMLLSPGLSHTNEVTDFWRGAAAKTKPAPAAPNLPPQTTNAAESKLALSALRDEQARLTAEATDQAQTNLAQAAAENERLLLAGQVPAPSVPTVQAVTPPPVLNLRLIDTSGSTHAPLTGSLKDKRAGLLAQMLEDNAQGSPATDGMTEAALRQVLNDAVREAASRTPQMRQIYAEYLAAEADVDQAKGQRWPQLSITAQTRQKYFGSERDTPPNPGNSLGVNLTTTLYDWGQTSKTIASRKELATANSEHYQAQLQDLAYQVTYAALEVTRQRNIVELYQRYVDRMQRLSQMLGEIVQADRGRASELTQAQARLQQAETSRDDAAAKASEAELQLRKLIGDAPLRTPKGAAWPIASANLDELLASAAQHPAIRQAAAQARAADLNTQATRAASLPKLSWVVAGNTGRDDIGYRQQPWATYLQVSWPLFSGGSQRAAAAAAQYRAEAQWQNAEQQKLDYEYQLRTADQQARSAFQRADEYAQLSQQTDQIRRGFFEQWYQLGQRSLLDVLSAESDYYTNRIGEVSSRFDAYQAVLRERASAGTLVNWLQPGPDNSQSR
jgi:outer membrane protein, adhesin transport system